MFLSLSCWSLSLSVFDMSFCVYFCMFPVCHLCCFILISMDLESEINDDDDDYHSISIGNFAITITITMRYLYSAPYKIGQRR